jgi:hypothetical protein
LNLLPRDVDIALTAVGMPLEDGGYGISWREGSLIQLTSMPIHPDDFAEPDPIAAETLLQDLSLWFAKIEHLQTNFPDIFRALREFDMTKCLPRRSRYCALWYFIILELLLTHNPNTDHDGLTHQVRTKMPLLARRFQRPLDVASFFGSSMRPDKLWNALYSYRSSLAHGGNPSFAKELKSLKDDQAVLQFMKCAVKLLILQAVTEPQLISDLKNC